MVPRGEGIAEIVRMSVALGARRRGLGRSIVEELVSTAAGWGASTVVLETSSSWVEVVDFYRSCGFEITHTEVGEFGEDTWFERRVRAPAHRAQRSVATSAALTIWSGSRPKRP